ncbi:MAG: flagellar FliJ family protein [Acidobacteriota bacterium]|nr:flagellar FliJ family protein [Acidobacteriota bacterium]
MAFQFSLATVLRIRGVVEDREERLLQRIQQELSQTRQALAQADGEIAESNASRRTQLFVPSTGTNVHAAYGGIEQLKFSRQTLETQLAKLEELKEVQLNVYRAARRDREMLADMRDRKRSLYDSDIARREQHALDDNFIARRGSRP